jgi:hypothetical protein
MKSALSIGFLFLIALAIVWCVMRSVSRQYSPQTGAVNFGINLTYTKATVQNLVRDHRADAAKYIYPGLFPLDLLFLVCLGGSIAMLSLGLGATPDNPGLAPMLLVLPVAYMVADLIENLLLAWLLSSAPEAIHDGNVTLVQSMTALKLACWIGGSAQVLWLAWSAFRSH